MWKNSKIDFPSQFVKVGKIKNNDYGVIPHQINLRKKITSKIVVVNFLYF
jgi:hypothetical protein